MASLATHITLNTEEVEQREWWDKEEEEKKEDRKAG